MKTLSRYFFNEFIKIFFICVLVITLLVILEDINGHLNKILSYHIPTAKVVKYYINQVINVSPVVLAISFFLTLISVLFRAQKNNEIIALRSIGYKYKDITKVFYILAIVVVVLLLILNTVLLPKVFEASANFWEPFRAKAYNTNSERSNTEIKDNNVHNQDDNFNRSSVFDVFHLTDTINNFRYYINKFNTYSGIANSFLVYYYDDTKSLKFVIFADTAWFDSMKKCWVLQNGSLYNKNNNDAVENFALREFKYLSADPLLMLMLQKAPRYLSFWQLQDLKDYIFQHENFANNPSYNTFLYQYYHYFVFPIEFFLLIHIVVLLLLSIKTRSHPFMSIWKILQLVIAYIAMSYLNKMLCNYFHSYMLLACLMSSVILLYISYRIQRNRV